MFGDKVLLTFNMNETEIELLQLQGQSSCTTIEVPNSTKLCDKFIVGVVNCSPTQNKV